MEEELNTAAEELGGLEETYKQAKKATKTGKPKKPDSRKLRLKLTTVMIKVQRIKPIKLSQTITMRSKESSVISHKLRVLSNKREIN